jgi:hypothetical protein
VLGWRLLATMSARVLPNPLLRECVLNHSNRRRFRPDAVGGLAFFVFQRIVMGGTWWSWGRRTWRT